jgi:hypothetical protein
LGLTIELKILFPRRLASESMAQYSVNWLAIRHPHAPLGLAGKYIAIVRRLAIFDEHEGGAEKDFGPMPVGLIQFAPTNTR